jgi:hypothetical protein
MFAPLRQSLEPSTKLPLDIRLAATDDLTLRNEDQVQSDHLVDLVAPEAFAQEPLRPIALHCVSHFPTDRQAQSRERKPVLCCEEHEQRAVETQPLPEHLSEVGRPPDPLARCQLEVRQPIFPGA